MNFYAWTGNRLGGHAQALMIFANAVGIGAAGLAFGWPGLAAAVAASLALWLGPWPRLARACGRKLDAWLFEPETARLAHERPPRRSKRRGDAHLPLYYRIKNRHGEHAAALLVGATGLGVIALAVAVWALGAAWGLNNPGSKAAATLLFGGILAVALWRPDLEWKDICDDNDWWHGSNPVTSIWYAGLPDNIHTGIWDNDD